MSDVIGNARKLFIEGAFREALSLLVPLSKKGSAMTSTQELRASLTTLECYLSVSEFKEALPYAKRAVKLASELEGQGSLGHAEATRLLAVVKTKMKDITGAKKNLKEAEKMLTDLDLQPSLPFARLIMATADAEYAQQKYQDALLGYGKAQQGLSNFQRSPSYGCCLNHIANCHAVLNQWTEAISTYATLVEWDLEIHGNQHSAYASSLISLGWAYKSVRQFYRAFHFYEEALAIYKKIHGENHHKYREVANELSLARVLLTRERVTIASDSFFRMCNYCGTISKTVKTLCVCSKSCYCNGECAKKAWPEHRPDCMQCYGCLKDFVTLFYCNVCHLVKYCSTECQASHKSVHIAVCVSRCYACKTAIATEPERCPSCQTTTYCSPKCRDAHLKDHQALDCPHVFFVPLQGSSDPKVPQSPPGQQLL